MAAPYGRGKRVVVGFRPPRNDAPPAGASVATLGGGRSSRGVSREVDVIPKAERKVISWKRPRLVPPPREAFRLTEPERENVRGAIRFLRVRLGQDGLARALGVTRAALRSLTTPRRPVGARLALAVARAAKAPVDDVLRGAWPKAGVCPHCGRG